MTENINNTLKKRLNQNYVYHIITINNSVNTREMQHCKLQHQ